MIIGGLSLTPPTDISRNLHLLVHEVCAARGVIHTTLAGSQTQRDRYVIHDIHAPVIYIAKYITPISEIPSERVGENDLDGI